MSSLDLDDKSRAMVLVAHPDDEIIWMGGTILTHSETSWTIVSLCRRSDPDRAPKFGRVAKHLGARGVILDVEDEGMMNIRESVLIIEESLRQVRGVTSKVFTHVFTHAYNGEYGHPRHKGVHRAVRAMALSGVLKTERLFYFGYEMLDEAFQPSVREEADICLELSKQVYAEKRRIVNEIYGFDKKSFEYKACLRREPFCKALI